MTTAIDLSHLLKLCEAATPGEWRAGRSDTVSYHGNGDGPYKNVYVDNPNGEMHLGHRLPDIVAEARGTEETCRANAEWIAAANPAAVRELIERVHRAESKDPALCSNGGSCQMCYGGPQECQALEERAKKAEAALATARADALEEAAKEVESWKHTFPRHETGLPFDLKYNCAEGAAAIRALLPRPRRSRRQGYRSRSGSRRARSH